MNPPSPPTTPKMNPVALQQPTVAHVETTPESQVQQGPLAPVSSQLLGMQFNPTKRRFHFLVGSTTATGAASGSVNAQFTLSDATTAWSSFIEFAPFALLADLSIAAVPAEGAYGAQLMIVSTWMPGNQSFPATDLAIREKPLATTTMMGPNIRGGFISPVTWPCTPDFGVQMMIKPTPYIGGVPRFAARVTFRSMTAENSVGGLGLLQWLVTATVLIDRSASQLAGGLA